jgi:hypothetical protein
MYTQGANNLVYTPGGIPVNFIPNIAVAIGTSASSTFQAGILYCGVGGTLAVVPSGQTNTVTFAGVPDGSFLPISVKALVGVTTADSILVCY